MNIGILTMQRVKNYGSFLVAYSLKKTLEAQGHKVIFVDYHIEKPIVNSISNTTIYKILRKIYRFIKEKFNLDARFEKQYKDFLNKYETEFWPILNIDKNYVYTPELDLLIIGSDEVFNCTQASGNVGYSKELFGYNNKAKRLISYAGSFGNTTLQKLEKYHIDEEIGKMLLNFAEISVRDENSYEIVNKLTNIVPKYNIDPVFIYDFKNETKEFNVALDNYIVIYAYKNRITKQEQKVIKEFAKKYDKKLVTLGTEQDFCDEYIPASPFEALSYIQKADYVITDTFHGTIFSIKYNKQFATIIRESNKQKLSDLLNRFHMRDREVVNISDLEDTLIKPINYEKTNDFINEQTINSMEYLKENIKQIEEI